MRIAVLLATYNGERFIEEQIHSIFEGKPKHDDLTLFISDDNSTDNTLQTITKLRPPARTQVVVCRNTPGKSGYVSNFNNTCKMAISEKFDYYFFSDQDDIWHKNKLSLMCSEVERLSTQHSDKPILVHCDLRVVNSDGTTIADSFIKYQHLPQPAKQSYSQFLHQNVATGCTFAFNHQLYRTAFPIPDAVLVHDWWFALVAKFYGIIHYIDVPLVDYRQHTNNAIGAISGNNQTNILSPKFLKILINYPYHVNRSIQQAKNLAQLAPEKLKPQAVLACEEYIGIEKLPLIKRVKRCLNILGTGKTYKEKLFLALVAVVLNYLPLDASHPRK